MEKIKYQWPMPIKYKIVPHDMYGMRESNYNIYKPRFHSGSDITADINTPINPMLPGVVTFVGIDEAVDEKGEPIFNSKYGLKVEMIQVDGNLAVFGHLRHACVKVGDVVHHSDVIALSGCSGGSRIPHLHLEIRRGNVPKSNEETTYDPLSLLPPINIKEYTKPYTTEPYCHLWNILNSEKPYNFTKKDIWWEKNKELIR